MPPLGGRRSHESRLRLGGLWRAFELFKSTHQVLLRLNCKEGLRRIGRGAGSRSIDLRARRVAAGDGSSHSDRMAEKVSRGLKTNSPSRELRDGAGAGSGLGAERASIRGRDHLPRRS